MKIAALAACAVVLFATSASADNSAQGPFYVQGGVGVNYWYFPSVQGPWAAFRPEIEAGFHVTGHHDGLSIGVRQLFGIDALPGRASGGTYIRGGYDLAFTSGTWELNVDPYLFAGVGYIFDGYGLIFKDGPSAGIGGGGGLDVKLFMNKGFYTYFRPIEVGVQCFHDAGVCALQLAGSVGFGGAFGQ